MSINRKGNLSESFGRKNFNSEAKIHLSGPEQLLQEIFGETVIRIDRRRGYLHLPQTTKRHEDRWEREYGMKVWHGRKRRRKRKRSFTRRSVRTGRVLQ